MTPQDKKILNHLKRKPITPHEALRLYGVYRLAARVYALRQAGYHIRTEMQTRKRRDGDMKRYARYFLLRYQVPQ